MQPDRRDRACAGERRCRGEDAALARERRDEQHEQGAADGNQQGEIVDDAQRRARGRARADRVGPLRGPQALHAADRERDGAANRMRIERGHAIADEVWPARQPGRERSPDGHAVDLGAQRGARARPVHEPDRDRRHRLAEPEHDRRRRLLEHRAVGRLARDERSVTERLAREERERRDGAEAGHCRGVSRSAGAGSR